VTVDDGAGHTDSAVIYAENGEEAGLVRDLTSSSLDNPAYFLGVPVQAEWPVYDDFDGTGDNTFHVIPDVLKDAQWITMGHPSKPENRTTLSFKIAPDAGAVDVFLLFTPPSAAAPPTVPTMPTDFLAGFSDTGVRGTWRDNALNLVPYALYRRTVPAGAAVRVPGAALDYVVLVKPHTGP